MRLLLAIDIDGKNPNPLLNEAILWAQRTGAKLDLAHVGSNAWALGAAADPEVRMLIEREAKKAREAEERRLDELLQRVPQEHRGTARILQGHPIEALTEAAADHTALLVGTHGRKGLQRFWLGSISEQIVRRAECPVLVLRLPDDE